MTLSPLERTVLAYFIAGPAGDLAIATRWYPHGELVLIIEDKIAVATRKFGFKPKACAKACAVAFLETMIAAGGWATQQNDFGGAMHQFQADAYRKALAEMAAGDAVVAEAKAGGEGFWVARLAELVG